MSFDEIVKQVLILQIVFPAILVSILFTIVCLCSKKIIKNYKFYFSGIFEVHITVEYEGKFVKLYDFILKHQQLKMVFAVSSVNNNQLMVSYFSKQASEKLVIDSANKLAKEMEQNEIKVLRVKVEGHNVKNTPQTSLDFFEVKNYLYKNYKYERPYFEFHVKVNITSHCLVLERICGNFPFVAVSYNICSSNCKPLLTIRVYNEGFIQAKRYKDKVLNYLKSCGYTFDDKIQQEFSIYDTNVELDNGWITSYN